LWWLCQWNIIHINVKKFLDVMFGKLPNELLSRKWVDHAIEVTLGVAPPAKASYRMNHEEFKEFKVQVEKFLAKGYIKPSKSWYGAPLSSSFMRRMGHWKCVWIIKPLTRWWWKIDTHDFKLMICLIDFWKLRCLVRLTLYV